jgi:hypothetical protein
MIRKWWLEYVYYLLCRVCSRGQSPHANTSPGPVHSLCLLLVSTITWPSAQYDGCRISSSGYLLEIRGFYMHQGISILSLSQCFCLPRFNQWFLGISVRLRRINNFYCDVIRTGPVLPVAIVSYRNIENWSCSPSIDHSVSPKGECKGFTTDMLPRWQLPNVHSVHRPHFNKTINRPRGNRHPNTSISTIVACLCLRVRQVRLELRF